MAKHSPVNPHAPEIRNLELRLADTETRLAQARADADGLRARIDSTIENPDCLFTTDYDGDGETFGRIVGRYLSRMKPLDRDAALDAIRREVRL